MFTQLAPILWATLIMVLWMSGLWLIHLIRKEADIVDAGWSLGLGILVVFYAFAIEGGAAERKILLALMVGFWSLRLTYYLLRYRVFKPGEDGRYLELREQWGANATKNFLIFFNAQGLLNVVLATVFFLILRNPDQQFALIEVIACMLWALAMLGEIVADAQLNAFRLAPENRGRTCNVGLWRYSRHPNYFFEWMLWVSYALMAFAAPWGWIGVISPVIMLILILKITGIPPTEARALRTRGDEYREYQRTTSAFVPWFPKEGVD